jgi:hypothetical protein
MWSAGTSREYILYREVHGCVGAGWRRVAPLLCSQLVFEGDCNELYADIKDAYTSIFSPQIMFSDNFMSDSTNVI